VRRTLLTIRAFNEAARDMVVWTALKGDVATAPAILARKPTAIWGKAPVTNGVLTDVG
jgi:hypothetical protein